MPRVSQFVNVSPIRDDIADHLSPEWLAIRPNTDVALMLGLAHTLETEGLADHGFPGHATASATRKFRRLPARRGTMRHSKDADWAASDLRTACGFEIRALAQAGWRRSRTLINTNWSLQRGDHGEQTFWMTVTLAAMLGGIGRPGDRGSDSAMAAWAISATRGSPRTIAGPDDRARMQPAQCWIPVARIADMLLQPRRTAIEFDGETRTYPDTRLVYWCGGNPFHHHQDLNRLVRAWRKPETIIVNEPWWTATAKFSDIVLPSTTTLERKDIGATSRDRFILAMDKAIEPVGDARNDFDIFRGLAQRLGTYNEFTEGREPEDWLRHIYDRAQQGAAEKDITLPSYDTFWEDGHVEIPRSSKPDIMFESFRADPVANALPSPSGRIEIFSETVDGFGYDDCPGHPVWREPAEWLGSPVAKTHPLHMISNQPRTRLHGQLDNGRVSRDDKINGREPIWINPLDAAERGLIDGDVVRVFNDRGALLAGARVTPEVRPGVVQLATGAWYDPDDPAQPNSLDKHGNPNVLTIDKGTSQLGQGPIAHSALVEIALYEDDLPDVTAHKPPQIVPRDQPG